MTEPSPVSLRDVLRGITDPASGKDIVTAGLVEAVEVRPSPHGVLVQVSLLTDRAHAQAMEPVRQQAEKLLAGQRGVQNVTAVLTAHKTTTTAAPTPG